MMRKPEAHFTIDRSHVQPSEKITGIDAALFAIAVCIAHVLATVLG